MPFLSNKEQKKIKENNYKITRYNQKYSDELEKYFQNIERRTIIIYHNV